MSNKYAVEFKNVSKLYKLNTKTEDSKNKRFYALKDVSFKVEKGEVVGFLGTNGSGKSTLFKILSGLSEPSKGETIINGETSLIAIRSGLKNKLTGLENIQLKGALMGLSKKQIEDSIDSIVEFSELGEFIHQPVKTYSSGMKSRLGFAISINLEPDIILVDEALSVGDSAFNTKCFNKIMELKDKGKTIFFVSHSMSEIKKFCTSAIWLESGSIVAAGDLDSVTKQYDKYMKELKSKSNEEREKLRQENFNSRVIEHTVDTKKKRNKLIKKLIYHGSILFIVIPLLLYTYMQSMPK